MALHRYSFGLYLIWNRDFKPLNIDLWLIWNRDFKPLNIDLWWKSQSRKCWLRSGFEDFQSFSVKWPCYSQLGSMKQFCFDEFLQSRNSNKSKIKIFRKTQQIFHRLRLLQSFWCSCRKVILFWTQAMAPVLFWSSSDLKLCFWAFSNGFVMEKSKQKVPA